ncbi:MAG: imidazolonepropionase [Acidimicrobiaceae bacterium]|nr:imidazolonepropionase [Acidimicrobiaceae bacterium]
MTSRLLTNIGELLTNDSSRVDETPVGRVLDAAIVVDEERVLWVGRGADAPAADEYYDARGAAVVPGFVDSHTHLIFAGERSGEFEARMAGERYDGGGIANTVAATRAASDEQLREQSNARLAALRAGGVTTVEVKSGYALDVDGEARLVRLAKEITAEVTFLGAHVVPREFAADRDGYVALVAGEMMTRCASAKWTDVFCDVGAFDVDEARTVLEAGRANGHSLRLHANQIADIGAVALAVETDCASVDHCTYLSDPDVERLAGSDTVATLLPGAEFSTRSPYPSGRRLLDAGVKVALATDCNPGTSYVTSMSFVIALAVREMGLSVDEALWAATRGGAAALRREDIGHLEVGARCDLVILNAPRVAHLAYRPGSSLIREVWRSESGEH